MVVVRVQWIVINLQEFDLFVSPDLSLPAVNNSERTTQITSQEMSGDAARSRGAYASISGAIHERFIAYVRDHIVNLAAAAEVFGLKKTTARAIWKRFKENGSMVPFSRGGSRRTKITEELKRFVALLINTEP